MIVGTAGHIDHGKTTLVRALTGVDTDRLKEEKDRGISIELGYAYVPDRAGGMLGFIDVPGHERLVHTMLAGACGIDFGLVVVAADDGVMPQTREHVAILDLLGVRDGAVALTKADRVDAAALATVRSEVAALLAPTALAGVPMFAVNATDPDDEGLRALREAIHAAARRTPRRVSDGLFRLAIDRSFTLPGHGTVVTGTVFAGRVEPGASLVVWPAGIEVRVRGLHTQGEPAAEGRAGERCAVNLAGVDASAVSRGDWLADPRGLAPTARIDANLHWLATEPAALAGYLPVHVHFGATHITGHALPLDGERIAPGESGRVQLVLERPVAAAPGERFILRNAQATRTVGGGVLLDPRAPARRRRSPARRAYLDAIERMLAGGDVAELLEAAPWGLSRAELMLASARDPGATPARLQVRRLACGRAAEEEFWVLEQHWAAALERIVGALAEFHAAHPEEAGPDLGRLRRMVAPTVPERLWRAAVEELIAAGRLRRHGVWLQLPEHEAGLSERERVAAERLLPIVAAAGCEACWVRDAARQAGETEERTRALLAALARGGQVYRVVRDLYCTREVVEQMVAAFERLATQHGGVPAAVFRDEVGIGRKRAVQILEFFDRVGYTRRVGALHVPREGGGWNAAR